MGTVLICLSPVAGKVWYSLFPCGSHHLISQAGWNRCSLTLFGRGARGSPAATMTCKVLAEVCMSSGGTISKRGRPLRSAPPRSVALQGNCHLGPSARTINSGLEPYPEFIQARFSANDSSSSMRCVYVYVYVHIDELVRIAVNSLCAG